MKGRTPPDVSFDKVVHERARLAILTYLAGSREKKVPFTALKQNLDLTAGNLSVQLRNLEEAGYVTIKKVIAGRKPATSVALTVQGKDALIAYIEKMEEIIRAIKGGEI